MNKSTSRSIEQHMPHAAAGFSVGLGLGLYEETVDGLLFAALVVALLVALQVVSWAWPLAFPRS